MSLMNLESGTPAQSNNRYGNKPKAVAFMNIIEIFTNSLGKNIEKKIGAIPLFEKQEEHRVIINGFKNDPNYGERYRTAFTYVKFNWAETPDQGLMSMPSQPAQPQQATLA
jgi:hypothetical protein